MKLLKLLAVYRFYYHKRHDNIHSTLNFYIIKLIESYNNTYYEYILGISKKNTQKKIIIFDTLVGETRDDQRRDGQIKILSEVEHAQWSKSTIAIDDHD